MDAVRAVEPDRSPGHWPDFPASAHLAMVERRLREKLPLYLKYRGLPFGGPVWMGKLQCEFFSLCGPSQLFTVATVSQGGVDHVNSSQVIKFDGLRIPGL